MKDIDELWKELEDVEFAIFIAKQSGNEDKIPALKRKMKLIENKIAEMEK